MHVKNSSHAQFGTVSLKAYRLEGLKWNDIKLATADEADAILIGASESSQGATFSGKVILLDRRTQVPISSTEKGKHASLGMFILRGVNGGKPRS
jgi:hypothetical protein